MATQLLSLGMFGVRLLDRILTAPAVLPHELADDLVDEINYYLPCTHGREQKMLFQLACELHEALDEAFTRVDGLAARHSAIGLVDALLGQARDQTHDPLTER
ncbi:hypothetical protein [Jeongeupia chitinilytica]|uniref:Uncharacterized protein n=1 Tax=Jeongeupia chitinilytica TaxID=1041641 RepID=A0ABQ3H418_9NEIS|nr:hypothetical protein [Jeongeupia chitinilytica]GHD69281.1 hypothetical protein GCM10007350_35850 [Jeongeupia chitinilytica]